jgi:glycosyltransferase involved in cell wall biosynthesis
LKIVIYGICKNEVNFVKRFAESIRGKADKVIFSDTGSTDGTQDLMRSYGFEVNEIKVEPWRFDVARNISLSSLPEGYDVAVCPDLDDIFLPNWRETIEKYWKKGKTKLLRYVYVNNWEEDEVTPTVQMIGFKIHEPYSFKWIFPVHEYLEVKGENLENDEIEIIREQILEHHPIFKEERKSRLKLFEDAFHGEYKDDPRLVFLYGRELLTLQLYEKALSVFCKHLDMTKSYVLLGPPRPNLNMQQRSMSCRNIAHCLAETKGDPNDIISWLVRSTSEDVNCKEAWADLANAWYSSGNGIQAYANAKIAYNMPNVLNEMEIESLSWAGTKLRELYDKSRKLMLEQENTKYDYTNEIEGWTTENELNALFNEAKKNESIVEIGSWKGRSTHALLSGNTGIVYAVDHWKGTESDGDAHKEAFVDSDAVYMQFVGNVGMFPNLKVMKMSSEEASLKFEDNSIDMVFIDGDHSYEAVKKDIELWLPKVKKIICGHDYNFKGVETAVNEAFDKINVVDTIWVHKVGT